MERIAIKKNMITVKQLEIVKIKAVIRKQQEYLHQDPGNYTNEEDIHPSRIILTNPTISEYFEYFHQYDFQPGSDSLVAADSLLKATNELLPHINGLAYQDIDVTKAYSQNLEHSIRLALLFACVWGHAARLWATVARSKSDEAHGFVVLTP